MRVSRTDPVLKWLQSRLGIRGSPARIRRWHRCKLGSAYQAHTQPPLQSLLLTSRGAGGQRVQVVFGGTLIVGRSLLCIHVALRDDA